MAIDELVVELPDEPGAVDAVCRGVRNVPGVGVEEVTELLTEAPDREDTVLAAAAAIVQAAHADGGHERADRRISWRSSTCPGWPWPTTSSAGFVEVHGDVPSVQWVAAFAEGSRSGADPANDTTGSGVFVEPVPETGFTVCGGPPVPIRRRERHEIALLVMVAARFMDAGWREAARATGDLTAARRRARPIAETCLVSGPCCASASSDRASSPGRTGSASRR